MPRRKTSRVRKKTHERKLHLKVSSPRIVGFECLRLLKKSARILIVLGLLGAAGWGAKSGMRKFFIENEEFRLKEVKLETNGELTEEQFVELSGIDLTATLFAIRLREIRERMLVRPGIVSVELSRRLPGTLRVKILERVPIAWLECRPLGIVGRDPASGLLLDEGGVCFPCEDWMGEKARALPVVLVSQAKEGDVTIGKQLRHHEAKRALELIKLSQRKLMGADWTLPVVAVRNDYSLEAAVSSGALAVFGMYDHERQLENLGTLLRETEGLAEPMAVVNLIPERNIPVTAGRPGATGFEPETRLQRDIKAILKQ